MAAENFFLDFILRARDEATAVMRGFGGAAGTVAHDMQLALGAVGLAAGAATFAAVKMAEDFDVPMRKVLALTGISANQFEDYKRQVLDLSTIVPKSAVDLANGLYFVVSAGFQGADAMKILEYSAKAASAGLTDTKTVADAVTSALNAYHLTGKDAARITDMLSEAVLQGKTEFGDFAGSIGRVLPIANAAGVSFDQVMASMATMTRVGLNADEAATALRGTLNALVKPTKGAAEELTKFGLSTEIVTKQLREQGLLFVLQELMDKTGGNIATLGQIIPNIRALTGVLATAGSQGEQYAAILKSMSDASGLTDEAFQKTAEGVSASGEIAMNSLKAIGITLGSVLLPPIAAGLKTIAGFARELHNWLDMHPLLAEWIAKGTVLVAIFGTLAGGAATLGAAIGFVGGHLGGLFVGITAISHGMLAFLGPIGLVIAAFLALKLGYENNIGGFKDFVDAHVPGVIDMFDRAKSAVTQFADEGRARLQAIADYIRPFVDAAVLTLSRFWTEIQPKLAAAWNSIAEKATWVIEHILKPILEGLGKFWHDHWDDIERVLRDVWGVITGVIRVAWDIISGLFKTFLDLLSGNWEGAWNDMSQAVRDVIDVDLPILFGHLADFAVTVWNLASALGEAIIRGIAEGLGNLKTWLWNQLLSSLGGMIDAAKKFLHISSPSQVFAEIGANMALGLAGGLTGGMGDVQSALSGLVAPSLSFATSSAGAGGSGAGSRSAPIHTHVILNGREILEAISDAETQDYRMAKGPR